MSSELDYKLKLKRELFSRAAADTHPLSKALTDSELGYRLCHMMRPLGRGQAYLLLLDRSRRLIHTFKLKRDGNVLHNSTYDKIEREVARFRPSYIAVAHNHVGTPAPSYSDLNTTHILAKKYSGDDTKFIGHYIVSGLDYLLLTPDGARCYHAYDSTERLYDQ